MLARRIDLEIIREILRTASSGKTKTYLIQHLDMRYPRGQEYLDFLCRKGFLTRKNRYGSTVYRTTNKGLQTLDAIDRVIQDLELDRGSYLSSGSSL
ncbi:MAG: winged helix-turn-helix domain-containing protein [Dehalococcoidia bacterium]